MSDDIEALYGSGACEYPVYSGMVDFIDEAETDYESLKKEAERLVMDSTLTADELHRVKKERKKDREENAKLRELVRKYGEYTDQDRCEGCVRKSRCNDGYVDECWQLTEIRVLARELGIEV